MGDQERLNAARADFEKVRDGGVPRGREAFVALLNVQSALRLQNLGNPVNYSLIGTQEQAFGQLLQAQYRLAARQNYEDSTDANFLPSGRPVTDALSDLHLAPAYMRSGGLNPARDADWRENNVPVEDFITAKIARLTQAAKTSWDQVRARTADPNSNMCVVDDIKARLRHAQILRSALEQWRQATPADRADLAPVIREAVDKEWDRRMAVEETSYQSINTTGAEIEAFRAQENKRLDDIIHFRF